MKCPCEQCISYAICNAKLKEMSIPEICTLTKEINCEALKDYIKLLDQLNVRYDRIDHTRTLFNLKPVNGYYT